MMTNLKKSNEREILSEMLVTAIKNHNSNIEINVMNVMKTFKGGRLVTNENMRFIVRAKIPTEAGNKMIQDPNFLKNLEDYMNKVKPEASYFFEADGDRVAVFVVDMQSTDQIPTLAEPLFQWMGAKVEFHPVMSLNDLKKAISGAR